MSELTKQRRSKRALKKMTETADFSDMVQETEAGLERQTLALHELAGEADTLADAARNLEAMIARFRS